MIGAQFRNMPTSRRFRPGLSNIRGLIAAASFLTALLMFQGGCNRSQGNQDPAKVPARNILLRLHGSNTVGAKAVPDLAETWLRSLGALEIRHEPGPTLEERLVVGRIGGAEQAVEVWSYGSNTGFNDLAWGKCDIAMSSKPVDNQTLQRLAALGNMRSPLNEHVIGLDGIAIIVHPSNPVEEMEVDCIADIFAGGIINWSLVAGGGPGTITPFSRNANSGTFDVFRHSVMSDRALGDGVKVEESNDRIAEAVAGNIRAIGYVPLAALRPDVKPLRVRRGAAAGLPPSKLNIVTEDYALSRRLFLYTAAAPANPWVREFIEFAQSESGQMEIEKSGYIAQILRLSQPDIPPGSPRRYVDETSRALRVGLNFRFRPGSFDLDNKARQDLVRLARFLDRQNLKPCRLKLFGFTDNTGSPARNRVISAQRAMAVLDMLGRDHEMEAVSAMGLGSALPIASNETWEGREKNRRIEVWLQCDSDLAAATGSN